MLSRAPQRVVRDWTRDSRQWDKYQPREGDVVVATAPKCGTTWTQRIVALLIFQSAAPRPIIETSPWIDCRFQIPIDVAVQILGAQTHRRAVKSHLPFDALPVYDEMKYIHVARDGRDSCMSFHNHFTNFKQKALDDLDGIGLSDETIGRPVPRPPSDPRGFYLHWIDPRSETGAYVGNDFFDLERSYWSERKRPNLLMVHYNDLKADLSGEMKRIAEFLEIDIPPDVWPSLVEAARFESMKKDGRALLPVLDTIFKEGPDTFLNRGTNERWREVLQDDDVELYNRRVESELSPGLASWLTSGRLKAGDPRTMED
jgi:aryl sulfotransferase